MHTPILYTHIDDNFFYRIATTEAECQITSYTKRKTLSELVGHVFELKRNEKNTNFFQLPQIEIDFFFAHQQFNIITSLDVFQTLLNYINIRCKNSNNSS